MTTKQILDSLYVVPALLDIMDKPTAEAARVLGHNGIGKAKLEEMRKLRPLLEYHLMILQDGFKESAFGYPKLRDGLKAYFDQYLSKIWFELGIRDTTKRLLDYGAGVGQYSDQFLADNMSGDVVMIDKEKTRPDITQINFEEDSSWYSNENYFEQFDLVLLAEVLHCKDLKMQKYLIQSGRLCLKPKGHLIIVENVDYAMAYRISKIKNEQRPVLDEKDIQKLMDGERFEFISQIQIEQHKIYRYEKI